MPRYISEDGGYWIEVAALGFDLMVEPTMENNLVGWVEERNPPSCDRISTQPTYKANKWIKSLEQDQQTCTDNI